MLASRAPAECAVTHTVELFRPGGGVTAGIMVDSLSPQRSPARNGNDGRSCVDYTGGPVEDGSGGGALCDVHGSPARLLAHSSNGAFYDPSRVRQTVSALELLEKKEVAKSGRGGGGGGGGGGGSTANPAASASFTADNAYAAENAALRRDVERARQRLEDVEDELQERQRSKGTSLRKLRSAALMLGMSAKSRGVAAQKADAIAKAAHPQINPKTVLEREDLRREVFIPDLLEPSNQLRPRDPRIMKRSWNHVADLETNRFMSAAFPGDAATASPPASPLHGSAASTSATLPSPAGSPASTATGGGAEPLGAPTVLPPATGELPSASASVASAATTAATGRGSPATSLSPAASSQHTAKGSPSDAAPKPPSPPSQAPPAPPAGGLAKTPPAVAAEEAAAAAAAETAEDQLAASQSIDKAVTTPTKLVKIMDEVFELIDVDNDGSLSINEVFSFTETLPDAPSRATVEGVFKRADKDGSNAVEKDEFLQLLLMLEGTVQSGKTPLTVPQMAAHFRMHCLRKLFDLLDVDGGGSISINEMRQLIRTLETSIREVHGLRKVTLSLNYSTSELDALFKDFDADRSGELDKEEFVDFLTKIAGKVPASHIYNAFVKGQENAKQKMKRLKGMWFS